MPMVYESDEVLPILPDGEPADVVLYNGVIVAKAETPIDVFDRSSFDYHIGDTGQATLPQLTSTGFDNDGAVWLPSGNPNNATNLDDSNSGYNSSAQDIVLENYLQSGEIAEVYLRPSFWGSLPQFRFAFFADGYYPSNHIRVRFTDNYFRLEQGSTAYGGTSDAESNTGFGTIGNWHRLVIDVSSMPTIECHLWDADTGAFIDTVSGTGTPDTQQPGHQFWWNADTAVYVSDYRKIESDDFTPGSSM